MRTDKPPGSFVPSQGTSMSAGGEADPPHSAVLERKHYEHILRAKTVFVNTIVRDRS